MFDKDLDMSTKLHSHFTESTFYNNKGKHEMKKYNWAWFYAMHIFLQKKRILD